MALVQDWFVVNGGAEKIVKELVALFPEATVFGLVDFLSDADRAEILMGKSVVTSFLQKFPNAKKNYRNYLPFFTMAIESLNFEGFDLIVSSSSSVAKGLKKKPGQLHICYCHSPIRYAWDLEDEYLSHLSWIKRQVAKLILARIRVWDRATAGRVDVYIANSEHIAERIRRIYSREPLVIYPPVDISAFQPCALKENYYFTSARMVAYKKIDLIVAAFNQMPHLQLVVSGDGPELEKLQSMSSPNIVFTGFLSKPDLVRYMQHAKAFILAAEEDFGITSLEAQACATPVIAYRKGGYLETVIENKTGVFFDEQSAQSIANAVLNFEKGNNTFELSHFAQQVNKFSIANFKNQFIQIVQQYVDKK